LEKYSNQRGLINTTPPPSLTKTIDLKLSATTLKPSNNILTTLNPAQQQKKPMAIDKKG
jgi:hypothetical protein